MIDYKKLLVTYTNRFQGNPRIFRSPGRINIIGEHIDYNDGFVLPAAVDKEIGIAMEANGTSTFKLYSIDQDEEVSFTLEDKGKVKEQWAQYIIGIIDQIQKGGHKIEGINCAFTGDIPMGAGMSSSAALECAVVYGLNELFGYSMDSNQMIRLAQRAENEYVGVNCGIMDQFASVFSKEGQAYKLDCRDLSHEAFFLKLDNYELVLVNSEVKHSLGSSEYNVRRAECEEGLKIIKEKYPEATALRDVSMEQLLEHKDQMKDKVFQRCKYVVNEIRRVSDACQALSENNLERLGHLLYETHEGLQHNYEVSCKELDFLVDYTRDKEMVLGARMMGGGFGGCTINLVHKDYTEKFIDEIKKAYFEKYNIKAEVYVVKTADGTSEVKI